ncbi:amino acid ABC transporter permease [Falsochrobactrum sp. TDYN1]|uniref:Amino acid ABC transporter permease n=1 Tax=Falsochrobactrum tianjinense TaxID=2706015 RepID=A0A949UUT8_9HYPH|nr:amino acid ABC transporter permease [Falsochrobactrum sp. TDYN1]MBV2143413.1 amino acid ABC transporter permease [Falsochrobactrum sp. TDYN1]
MTISALSSSQYSDAPPRKSAAFWFRVHFFSSISSSIVTIVGAALIAWLVYVVGSWAFINSVWTSPTAQACQSVSGACWSVIYARAQIILFGLYPFDEHWRSAAACIVVVVVVFLSCFPVFWTALRLSMVWIAGAAIFFTLMHGGILGLSVVPTDRWGGLSLTVYIFASVCLIGMPASVMLALARQSRLPVVRKLAALLIDLVRSLPLLAILFSAALIIPFALPEWLQGDKLTRVIVAFALFFACYQAENIRAGMQILPAGQEEAAKALGLNYWQRTSRIILPQAFRNSLPPMINQFVMTFKDTSVITIVGFFDVLASAQAAFGTAEWAPYYIEVYVFVGFIYFVFIFSLSRYGAYLEKRMRIGHE